MVKVGVIVGTWKTLPHAKFCKNCLRGYTPLKEIYTKNYQFLRFGGCKPTFLKPQRWNLAWGWESWSPSPMPNFVLKNRLRGYTLWGKFTPKITETLCMPAKDFHFLLLRTPLHILSPEDATTLFHKKTITLT